MPLDMENTASKTSAFYRRPWLLPLLAAIIFAFVSRWAISSVDDILKRHVSEQLQAMLNANVEALRIWIETEKDIAQALAGDRQVVGSASELLKLYNSDSFSKNALTSSGTLRTLREYLEPKSRSLGFEGWVMTTSDGMHIAASDDEHIGHAVSSKNIPIIEAVVEGETVFGPPFIPLRDFKNTKGPLMFISTGIQDGKGKGIAALSFILDPNTSFNKLLSVSRAGESGETYAFNSGAVIISQSRFDEELKQIGILSEGDSSAALTVELRDPGVDLTTGAKTDTPRKAQPFTFMAAQAISGKDGINVEGYRDYRGVKVVGAWTWLREHRFGVTTEMDRAEAYELLYVLRGVLWPLVALLAFSSLALYIVNVLAARQRKRARSAERKAQKFGQYTLGKKIGAGGIGEVYRASHDMLQRPAALKLLKPGKVSKSCLIRFEREVQLTCRLTHMNTIKIYDYGRTADGTFFYTMELLQGRSLKEIITDHGSLPEYRVVHIFKQACSSLREAHEMGLVHRDIKPANIMLCVLGAVPDFVKVLDFGLVKFTEGPERFDVTGEREIAGTPRFLSPEAIRRPLEIDARSDIYALGATAYYLLTGKHVFSAQTLEELIAHHLDSVPEKPSKILGKQFSPELENLILSCLEKYPENRPQTVNEMLVSLSSFPESNWWKEEEATEWWKKCYPEVFATEEEQNTEVLAKPLKKVANQ